jgi:hypothetical protein
MCLILSYQCKGEKEMDHAANQYLKLTTNTCKILRFLVNLTSFYLT